MATSATEYRIEYIVCGFEKLPADDKCCILLYELFGTGKTTPAKMLPEKIELGRTGKDIQYSPIPRKVAIDMNFVSTTQN